MKSIKIIFVILIIFAMIIAVLHWVHPILIMTFRDIFYLIITDLVISGGLAMYLKSDGKNNNFYTWLVIGMISFTLIPICASVIKYNRK
jgi:hypothetical protein